MPKRAIHDRFGEPRSVLRVVDVAAEQPEPEEVIIRMEAAAMHIADLRTIAGAEGFRYPLPRTPGYEGIGRVVRVGERVISIRVGDRVFPALGSGTFREEVRCRADACMAAPEGDALQLSLLTVNGPTAWVLLEDFARLCSGDWLIQNAANSSCGRYVVQLAHRRGLRTINVVRRTDLVDEMTSSGADLVLLDGPDLAERVEKVLGGAPIRLGIDAVAGEATQRIAECLASDSPLICYGAMSGEPCKLDFYLMFRRGIMLQGISFVRQLRHRTPAQVRQIYSELASLMASGGLIAPIAGVFPLNNILEACDLAARTGNDRNGKVIITFGE
ncbi:MAG: zinc-dependent alcohol dehydrogenase family protein [Gammaproteobacteria bacterium]|nr:zinc-dependent alcohol dehydrogenase family protein [Gammaproteobacteria bacterium]